MDFEAVKKGINSEDFVLIDVRSPDEVRNDGKIPSSHLIPRKYILYIHELKLPKVGKGCLKLSFLHGSHIDGIVCVSHIGLRLART